MLLIATITTKVMLVVVLVVVLVVMREYMHMNCESFFVFVFTVAYFGFLLSLEKDFVDQGSKPNNIKYIFFFIETNETLLKTNLLVKYFLKPFNYFN